MLITRKSPLTGIEATMDLNVTEEQMLRWSRDRELIQNAMPQLTDEEREFIMTGYTPEDWAKMFPPEDEEIGSALDDEGSLAYFNRFIAGDR